VRLTDGPLAAVEGDMITRFFEAECALRRLQAPTACAHIDSFAASLTAAGYARGTARGYLRAAAHLGRWADDVGLTVARLDERAVRRFCRDHLPKCRCIKRNEGRFADVGAGARAFVVHLRALGVVSPLPPRRTEAVHPLHASFGAWMQSHRGLTASTVAVYQRALRPMLRRLGDDPSEYSASALRAFVVGHSRRVGGSATKTLVVAARTLVRYLIADGQCPVGLELAIPSVARWRLSTLPRYLDAGTVRRVLEAAKDETPRGLRDHAVLLLLARLGLRAGDVAALRFDDIDWNAATVRVQGKGRREARLPLPQDVGDALIAYIKRGRVPHPDPRIFLRVRAPYRPFLAHHGVSYIVEAALRRAGVESRHKGAHLMRHSAATAMLRAGATLDAIGAVLRHRSTETTLQYAKVDVAALTSITQPWPEVRSC
jgi:site-specific recombinase XerD